MVPWQTNNETYKRYYHVFIKGELDELVNSLNMGTITKSGYDRDNWFIIVTKNQT